MFGASNNNTTGGMFGGANTNNSGNLFGQTNTGTTPAFGQSSGTTTGFGQQSSTNAFGQQGSTNAFGQQPAANAFGGAGTTGGTGLFGQQQQQPATNAFGAGNTNNTGTGLFGQSNTQQSSGLFGNAPGSNPTFGKPAATTTGGGLFGGNTSSTASQPLFGNQASNTGAAPAATGGLFGNTTTGTSSGGIFGNKQAATSGIFGSGANTNTNTTGTTGGIFGNKPAATNLFGQQQQQQQPQQQQQQPAQPTGLFSNTTNTQQPSFTWSQPQQTQPLTNPVTTTFTQANPNVNTYTPAINDQLIKVWEQWDPTNGKCLLKTHLYNKFSDQEISLLNQQRPANETPEDWDNAMLKRPGPNYYPIKVTSFNDIASRIETQLDHVVKSRILLNSMNEKLTLISSKHDLENTTRILKAKARHSKLSRRLLRLATILAILKLKGYPLLPEEEEISKQFDLLIGKLNDPSSSIGKLSDVFARLTILKERAEDLNYRFDNSISSLTVEPEKAKDQSGNSDEIINKISKVLLKQQMGLNYLNDVLEKDAETLNKLEQK
ncbi:Nucleoporin NUP57 [Spathaspora sp. JA1]|nr:Nucleoporin NUP57 [Spathaspora sp. JA1]